MVSGSGLDAFPLRVVHRLERQRDREAPPDDVGIVWWIKPPDAGFLAFLDREAKVFVDRERRDEAASIARRILEPEAAP